MFHTISQGETPDFARYATGKLRQIDKTLFIKEIVEANDLISVFLYPPSGKSFNLSMLRYFFDDSYRYSINLFDGMAISHENEYTDLHQNKYSVIYLDFSHAHAKAKNADEVEAILFRKMCRLAQEHIALIQSLPVSTIRDDLENLAYENKIPTECLSDSLCNLIKYVRQYNEKNHILGSAKPFVIIDSFDSIINYHPAPSDKGIALLQSFFGRALKDNPNLIRAVIAGVSDHHQLLPDNCTFFKPEDVAHSHAFGLSIEEAKVVFDFYKVPGELISQLNPDFYRIKSHDEDDITMDPSLEGKGFRKFSKEKHFEFEKELLYRETPVFNPDQVFKLVNTYLANQDQLLKWTSYSVTSNSVFKKPQPMLLLYDSEDSDENEGRYKKIRR